MGAASEATSVIKVEFGERALDGLVHCSMRPITSAPASARKLIDQAGIRIGLRKPLRTDAAVVAGGLVLHSVISARTSLTLRAVSDGDSVLVEVEDAALELAARPADSPAFHGLDAVGRIAAAYGYLKRESGGRVMWARIGSGALETMCLGQAAIA